MHTLKLFFVSLIFASLVQPLALANNAVRSFDVSISLNGGTAALASVPPASVAPTAFEAAKGCVSGSLSASSNAIVRVVCGSNQFVSIEPRPGAPILGTNGGAFRFNFGPGAATPPPVFSSNNNLPANPYVGVGTVTSFRVLNLVGDMGLLEFLVSF